MLTNKELKESGKKTVRKHYLLLLILCAIAVLFGNEFGANDGILHLEDVLGGIQHEMKGDQNTGAQTDQNTGAQTDQGTGAQADQDGSGPDGPEIPGLRRLEHRIGTGLVDTPAADVIADLLHNDLLDGISLAETLSEQFEESGTDVVGHTEGVLAYVVNTVSSGTLAIYIFVALDVITGSNQAAVILFTLIGLLFFLFFCVCVPEIYAVILRRFFMEARVYEKVPLQHGFHLLKIRHCVRADLSILLKDTFFILWCFTIVGGFIKRYSYFLVPFIVAENPDIRPLEAIRLSRRMMDGHKMEAFKFEMSFFHWLILGILTLGLSNVFYYLPYKVASTTEYYACVRRMAKEAGVEGVQLLDDEALIAKADQALLKETYADTAEEVFLSWEQMKQRQRGNTTAADRLRDVSAGLPGLLRAEKMFKKAEAMGIDAAGLLDAGPARDILDAVQALRRQGLSAEEETQIALLRLIQQVEKLEKSGEIRQKVPEELDN